MAQHGHSSPMFPFTPRYIKHAKLLHKGVTRFVNYKRDLLPPAKLEQIEGLRAELMGAIKARDAKRIDELHEKLNDVCNRALPDQKNSDFADNVEVFFVAIVIALGIRAYIAQPFQIPTGSMQPTLNGYIAEGTKDDPSPNLLKRIWDKTAGKTYINVVSDHDGALRAFEPVTEHRWLILFTYSTINFADGHTISVSAPQRQVEGELGFRGYTGSSMKLMVGPDGKEAITPDAQPMRRLSGEGVYVTKGQVLARGVLNAGDHILVNKFAYHFRQPKRGEVFVFTTKNVRGIPVPPEQGSQHYIKRLVGVPGDSLEVRPPELWVNGKPAEEFGMKRVASAQEPYQGYAAIENLRPGKKVNLDEEEYWAMGDNSFNSSDSRYWGAVPERNIVGPALFCYLPFTSHWGPIR